VRLNILIIFLILFSFFGCANFDSSFTKALTTSANVRLEPINRNKAIAKYDYGALIESDGKELVEKAIKDFCPSKEYRIITEGKRISGEKKFTVTIVFECID